MLGFESYISGKLERNIIEERLVEFFSALDTKDMQCCNAF